MNHNLLEAKETLILAPHPDDEALGCSGTIMLLNKAGASSTVVFLTEGERLYGKPDHIVGEERRQEGYRASVMLGCKKALFLGFPDGEVNSYAERIYRMLYEIIERKKPDTIFSPSPIDYHQDHIATAKIALRLLSSLHSFKLAFYEVYETLRFNQLIDISEFIHDKERIIMNYKRSLYDKPELYVHASLGLNAQRSIFTQNKGYYEAFIVVDQPINAERIYDWSCYRSDDLS